MPVISALLREAAQPLPGVEPGLFQQGLEGHQGQSLAAKLEMHLLAIDRHDSAAWDNSRSPTAAGRPSPGLHAARGVGPGGRGLRRRLGGLGIVLGRAAAACSRMAAALRSSRATATPKALRSTAWIAVSRWMFLHRGGGLQHVAAQGCSSASAAVSSASAAVPGSPRPGPAACA